ELLACSCHLLLPGGPPRRCADQSIDAEALLLLELTSDLLELRPIQAISLADTTPASLLHLVLPLLDRLPISRNSTAVGACGPRPRAGVVPAGPWELRRLARLWLRGGFRLAPVDHSPGLVTDHAVRGKTIGLLPFLRLSDRARTPVAISLGADSLLGTLDRL